MEKCDFSIVIVSYFPKWDALKRSVLSVLMQKSSALELIIADDGSTENYFDELKALFQKYDFDNYVLIPHERNAGTVLNLLSAVEIAKGRYLKALGTGDMLYDENTLSSLRSFINNLEDEPAIIVSDVVNYYMKDDNTPKAVVRTAIPQINNYANMNKAKYNILVLEDAPGGPANIYRTDIIEKYLKAMAGKVRLAEDLAVKLMIADDQTISFWKRNAVIYEIGTGVTAKKEASQLMLYDREQIQKLLINKCDSYKYKRQIIKHMNAKTQYITKPSRVNLIKWICSSHKMFVFFLQKKICPRKTLGFIPEKTLEIFMESH